jgi:hypothetical protein
MAKMTEDELVALTDLEIRNSVGYFGGKLAEQRRKATSYYLALPEGDLTPPEIDGRSAVIDPFVRNTIEAMLPQLMVKFTGGDSVVEFEATKPGDEQKATNCTDYLNYLFWKKNRGHTIAETWMRDALLYKNGVLKVWWDTRYEETKEEYKGLTQVELSEVMDDEEVEVTESRAYPDEEDAEQRQKAIEQATQQLQQAMHAAQQPQQPPQPGQPPGQAMQAVQQIQQHIQQIQAAPPVMLYDITAKRTKKGGKLAIDNVPPEEFLINRRAKSIATASFIGHRTSRTMSDLRSMGYPASKLENLSDDDSSSVLNAEKIERDAFDDEQAYLNFHEVPGDESQKTVWVVECYLRCDWDGDGIAELRKVTKVGNQILDNEECDLAPFADIVCIRQPHKFFGLSIMDLGQQTQLVKTSLLRSRLDNEYLETNGRYFAVENQVNLDDLLTSRPGGVVRIKQAGAVGRLDQGMGNGAASMQLLEYMEGFGESATGWTRYSQGNSAGKLGQSTATGMNIIANRDDMRVDLIARNFAEGFVELFRQMLKLVCQHQDKKAEVQIGGDWVDIDPREWRNQFDVNINVGLGVGGKEQQIQQVMAVIQQQEKVHAIGVASPENIYNASCELAKLTGQKNGDKYFTDPVKNPPPPPPPPPEALKGQVAQQIAQANGQVTIQVESAKLQAQMQLEREKAQLTAQTDLSAQQSQQAQNNAQNQAEMAMKEREAQLEDARERDRMMQEAQLKAMEFAHKESEGDKERATKVLIAQIAAQVATSNAALAAEAKADQTAASD